MSQDRVEVSETFGTQTFFSSSLTLSDISQHDSGEYCCTASIAGNETKSNYCVELKVTTGGEYIAVTEAFIVTILSDFIIISGNFKNLQIGSTVQLICRLPNVMYSTINWLSHDGSVVSSSGALILQSVNYTINGRMFTCSVNSPQLTNRINETITVTVQGEHDTNVHKLLNIVATAATSVSNVTIINPPPYVVDGDQNVELQCTVTLSSTIGPDYSALSIDWRDSTDTIINNCSSPQPHGNSDTFSCNLTLATISATSAGLYTCNAAITEISGLSTDLIILQVQGLEMKCF